MSEAIAYRDKLKLIPVIQCRDIEVASEWVKNQYGGFEIPYDEATQNWIGTPYYYDEEYLWIKGD